MEKKRGLHMEKNEKKKSEGLHPFIILVTILLIAAVVAYFIPSGAYERITVDGRTVVNPDSYQVIADSHFSFTDLMTAIPRGIAESINVVVITFMIGGAFGIIKETGMLALGVKSLVKAFEKNKIAIIFILIGIFVLITGFIGVPELALIYIPILIPLFFSLGFDSMVAIGVSLTATAAGFSAAWSAPATVGLGHQLAELPMYSGMGLRVVTAILLAVSAAIYVAIYAKKVAKNPESSLVYEQDLKLKKQFAAEMEAEEEDKYPRVRLAGIVTILLFIGLIFGVVINTWGFEEMSGYFIILGIVPGLIAGMTLNETLNAFVSGLKDMIIGAFIIGIARGISVVLNDAQVMDTIIMYLASAVVALPSQIASLGIFIVTTLFNAVIASGSGKAVIALPIMLPLADIADVSRQTTILAYQLGDGITNIVWPASGYFMAALAISNLSYKKWIKWFFPLLIVWLIIAAAVVIGANYIGYGPF